MTQWKVSGRRSGRVLWFHRDLEDPKKPMPEQTRQHGDSPGLGVDPKRWLKWNHHSINLRNQLVYVGLGRSWGMMMMYAFFFLPAKEGTFKFESIWTSRNEKSIKKSLALVHLDPTSRISWMPHPVLFFPWGSILKQNITAKECGIIHIYIYMYTYVQLHI